MIVLNDDTPKPDTLVYRFQYNPSIRFGRYIQLMLGLSVGGLLLLWNGAQLDAVLVLSIVGSLLMAIAAMEFYLLSAKRRVIEIDMGRREFRLEQFVYPISFYDIKPKNQVVIQFDEVLGIERLRSHKSPWDSFIVYTTESKFGFSDYFSETPRLIALIEEIAKDTDPVHPARNMMVLGFAAGLLGLLVVAFLGWLIGWI